MHDKPTHEWLGCFDLSMAKQICALLKDQSIDFELEIDDSEIRNLSPFQAAYGGTYGSGASANIYVEAQSLEQCETLLSGME